MFLLRTTSLFGILSLQYLLLLILMYHETKEQSRPPSSFAFYNPLTFYFEKELLCPYVLILHCRSWMPYNITVHFTGSSFNVLYHVINLFLYQVSKLQKCVSTSSAIYSLLFNVRKKMQHWLWGDWVHLSMLYKTMALHNVIEIFQKCSA